MLALNDYSKNLSEATIFEHMPAPQGIDYCKDFVVADSVFDWFVDFSGLAGEADCVAELLKLKRGLVVTVEAGFFEFECWLWGIFVRSGRFVYTVVEAVDCCLRSSLSSDCHHSSVGYHLKFLKFNRLVSCRKYHDFRFSCFSNWQLVLVPPTLGGPFP